MYLNLIIYTLGLVFFLNLIHYWLLRRRNSLKESQRYPVKTHVVISGGSKGIGRALAKRFAELGTHVTIIARNERDLLEAKSEIEKHRKNASIQQIRTVSLDLAKLSFPDDSTSDMTNEQKELLEKILGEHDRCDILINCCGSSIANRFADTSKRQFEQMMQVNYFSAVNLTRLILPGMKVRSLSHHQRVLAGSATAECGRIVFVSSMCGLMSFFGYSAYSASKFALVGLAEALHMELKPFDIGVTVSFPPDTDTPGFEEENKTKPALTSKISSTGSVYSADAVAMSIISDLRSKKFYSTIGIENLCVLTTLNTFMPAPTISKVILESFIVGPLRLVGYFILRSWYQLMDEAAANEIIKAELALKSSKTKYDDKKS